MKRIALKTSLAEIFPTTPTDKLGISVQQLLTHTSGLAKGYAANGCRTRASALEAIFELRVVGPPGAAFEYTDDGYALLAAIIESVSSQTYSTFVRKNVFEVAGMLQTRFWDEVDDRREANVARIVTLSIEDRYRGLNWGYIGSGGIWSTADDLARFFHALRSGMIVNLPLVEQMMSPQVAVSIGACGFGWFIGKSALGTPLIFARGNEDWGHSSLIYWYPDHGALQTIVTNSGFANGVPLSRSLASKFEGVLNS